MVNTLSELYIEHRVLEQIICYKFANPKLRPV